MLHGKCLNDDNCDLSHNPTFERVPTCLHFLRGCCTNTSCRYAHIRVNPSAPVCREFSIFKYCSKGANCSERHVNECADWSNKGACQDKKCRLPHVDRAGQIRRQTTGYTTISPIFDLKNLGDNRDTGSDEFNQDSILGQISIEAQDSKGEDFVQF